MVLIVLHTETVDMRGAVRSGHCANVNENEDFMHTLAAKDVKFVASRLPARIDEMTERKTSQSPHACTPSWSTPFRDVPAEAMRRLAETNIKFVDSSQLPALIDRIK